MIMRKLYFLISVLLATGCFAAGYATSGQWQWVAVSLLLGLSWLLAWKYSALDAAPVWLAASVILGAVGILVGSQPGLMICASAFALAAWDALLLNSALKNINSHEKSRVYETRHFKLLFLAVGGGLLAALLGQMLSFQVPFLILMLLTAALVFLLERVWRTIVNHRLEG